MSIINELANKRFNLYNLPKNVKDNLRKLIGPVTNFYNIKTVHKLNFRIFLNNKNFSYRILNSHFQQNIFNHDIYIKSFLRVYSDGIFISVKFFIFIKNRINPFLSTIKTIILKKLFVNWASSLKYSLNLQVDWITKSLWVY